ncbi:MAG: acyltransferase [Prevotella sp.]|nr:acyltransferase [Prevotella sp.]
MENSIAKKPRLEWLDALRGFTMILVVAFHTIQGFGLEMKTSSSMQFLVMFRMPLFFFVSGFLAYKAGLMWNFGTLGSLLAKKIRVQTVPTIVFFLFGAAILGSKQFGPTIMEWLERPTKGGYWFTIVLLYMFIIYYLFCFLESWLQKHFPRIPSWLPITILFLISMACYDTCYQPRYFDWALGRKGSPNEFMNYSSFGQLFIYFPFFLYGNIVRRYWDKAQEVMDSKWFYPTIICLVIYAWFDYQKWHWLRMAWAIIPLTMARFILLTMVFMYFRHYQQYFTQRTAIGASLQYIGRRTLDIYLIHFLFLPNLPTVGSFFNTYRHNFVLDTSLSVFLALLVIGFSIITSNILRISPFFKKWLFGRV